MKKILTLALCAGAMIASVFTPSAVAQIEVQALLGNGGVVDTDGARLIVGAYRYNLAPSSVTIYARGSTGWIEETTLTHPPPSVYGGAVAIDGDLALVSDQYDDEGCGAPSCAAGAVYALVRAPDGTWSQTQKLLPNEPVGPQRRYTTFGEDVALSGRWAIIRGNRRNEFGPHTKVAYFFEYVDDAWVERQWTTGGGAVDLDLPYALHGDRVYRLDGATWVEDAMLKPSLPNPSNYGFDVALNGDQAAVTSLDHAGINGRVFLFQRTDDRWTEEAILETHEKEEVRFGSAVSFDGDVVVVGDWAEETGGSGTGSAYVFQRQGTDWTYTARLYGSQAGTPRGRGSFGASIRVLGREAVVGATSDGDTYIFDLTQTAPAPRTETPEANTQIEGRTVTFSWAEVEGATGYRLQIWRDMTRGNGRTVYLLKDLMEASLTFTNFPFTSEIDSAYVDGFRQFAWRVGADFPEGAGPFSAPSTFTLLVEEQEQPVANEPPEEPAGFLLEQNYPNPFRTSTTITFSTPSHSLADARLYDALGREAAVLFEGSLPAGEHRLVVDGKNLPSGTYLCRLRIGQTTRTLLMTLIR